MATKMFIANVRMFNLKGDDGKVEDQNEAVVVFASSPERAIDILYKKRDWPMAWWDEDKSKLALRSIVPVPPELVSGGFRDYAGQACLIQRLPDLVEGKYAKVPQKPATGRKRRTLTDVLDNAERPAEKRAGRRRRRL